MLLNCSNITKSYGTDTVIMPSSFGVYENDKVGIVGANGAGKTTLFKILTDELSPDGGAVHKSNDLKIKYLEQHVGYNSDRTVMEEIEEAFADVIAIEAELNRVTELMQGSTDETLIMTHHNLSEKYKAMDGFAYRSRAKSALMGLGFEENDFSKPFSALSGGQKTRVMLCKILLSGADLLLLDEPTNHLDLDSVVWLENFLSDYNGAFMVISHDRYFLDKITNKTFDMDNSKITCYNGNYSKYLILKEEAEKTAERKYENQMDEIHKLEGIIKQQKQWNRERNIKTAESKQKAIDRIKAQLETPQAMQESIRFSFNTAESCGNEILDCKNMKMGFNGKILFENGNVFIKKQEKVFLTGGNGCGKTTFIKIINGEIEALGGEFKLGANVKIGYYDQTQECLDLHKSPFEQISDDYPKMTNTEVRNALAAFLFRGDDVFKQISELSGGERARVALLKLLLSGANFLILDEPTNHLDIRSREALEKALDDYDGTVLAVSHDRYFIEKLATKIYHMECCEIKEYNGGYAYFCEKHKEIAEDSQKPKKNEDAAISYKEQKRIEAEKRKKENLIKKTEEQIEQTETEIERLNNELLSPEIATDYVKATELTDKINELSVKLDKLYTIWEELSL